MSKISKLVQTIALCAAASAAVAGDASRASATARNTSVVRFGDLNLETAEGAQKLYSRLRVAANGVCNVHTAWAGLAQKAIDDRCVNGAIANAVAKVNKPQLTAYHRSKSGRKDEQVLSKL